jgi:ABC-type multidrug transport system fused ATPase/permease subunit
VSRFGAYARRELVFLALGTMDVCVITPLLAALLSPLLPVRPVPVTAAFLGAVLAAHYLARLAFRLPLAPAVRPILLGIGMLVSGLLAIHRLVYAPARFLDMAWLAGIFRSLRQANVAHQSVSHDVIIFLLVLFLWWRGLVLAQRQLDAGSVAFRFRLGLVMLAVTTAVGGIVLPWPSYYFVFLFFFASLLGIALARAEEVGQQYGGSQSPFSLGWLGALVAASVLVLLLAAGVAALLTGENVSRFIRPLLEVLRLLFLGLAFVLGFVVQFLVVALRFLFGEISLEDLRRGLSQLLESETTVQPEGRLALLSPDQLALVRTVGIVAGVLLLVAVVALSLRRLRVRAGREQDEQRESVWEGAHLRRGLRDLLRRGRRRLDQATDALSHSFVGRLFAALTIRRIYAHMGALAAGRGYPRPSYQTPYEYLPALEEAFPDRREEVDCITEAYVAVHYGEVPERPENLARVQAAWEAIRGPEA